jgi:hypothetical protein
MIEKHSACNYVYSRSCQNCFRASVHVLFLSHKQQARVLLVIEGFDTSLVNMLCAKARDKQDQGLDHQKTTNNPPKSSHAVSSSISLCQQ